MLRKNSNIVGKLIMLNIFVFLIQLFSENFTETFLLNSQLVLSRPWTLLTATFLHASPGHIFFNMYVLLMFGPLIENRIGSKRFLTFYLISGILSSLAFVLYSPGSALGASGAVMGVVGMVIMLFPNLKVLFFFIIPMSMRTAGIVIAFIDIFGMFNPASGIAHISHLAGLACGLFFGNWIKNKTKQFYENFDKKRTYKTKRGSKVYANTDPSKVVIELSDDDVQEYLKNGRL